MVCFVKHFDKIKDLFSLELLILEKYGLFSADELWE